MSSSPRTSPARPSRMTRLTVWQVLLIVLVVVGLVVTFATNAISSLFPPTPATTEAKQIHDLYDIVFYIAAAIFFVVEGLILWTVLRYRRRPGDDELPPQTHGNNVAEIAWTIVPTIIVIFLFFISWQTLNSVEAVSQSPDLKVRAIAGQFQWTFEYLDQNGQPVYTQNAAVNTSGSDGGLVLPVGKTIELRLKSPDVIHAFYVPAFLFKRDVVPDATGRENMFDLTVDPTFAGQTIHGQCAELCGIGHRIMLFDVRPMQPADFDAWLQGKIQAAQATQPPAGSGGPPAVTLNLVAQNVAYDTKTLEAPADKPFAIDFENKDNAIPHNVAIKDEAGNIVFKGADVTTAGKVTDSVPPLKAGTYQFFCTFHPIPAMTGTLTVK